VQLANEVVANFLFDWTGSAAPPLPQVAERLNGVRHEAILSS
jgi:hypothetical protein